MLKILVESQFMDDTYSVSWKVMLRKEPFCTDLKNLLNLVEIMLMLPIFLTHCVSKDFQHITV